MLKVIIGLLWIHAKISLSHLGESLSRKMESMHRKNYNAHFHLIPTCVTLKLAVLSPPPAPKCSFVFHMYLTEERRASRRETPLPQSILAVRK